MPQSQPEPLTTPAELLVNVTGFDLLVRKCEHCQEHHIFGFYGQLTPEQKQIDRERMIVTISDVCKCGQPITSEYGLFTSPDGSAAKEIAKVREWHTASQGRLIEVSSELEKAKSENCLTLAQLIAENERLTAELAKREPSGLHCCIECGGWFEHLDDMLLCCNCSRGEKERRD